MSRRTGAMQEEFLRQHRGLIKISRMNFTDVGAIADVLFDDSSRSSTVLDRQVEDKKDGEVEEEKGRKPSGPRIRCPLCGWSPRKDDHWACKCGHTWNTFDTGGVCPACLYQWTVTKCPSCHRWSPHSDWYTQE